MGNKPSRDGNYKMTLDKQHSSEEDYLPMPLSMRRVLQGKKFHHVAPSRASAERETGGWPRGWEDVVVYASSTHVTDVEKPEPEPGPWLCAGCAQATQHVPGSPPHSPARAGDRVEVASEKPTSPSLNRRYSEYDLQTGTKKSRFTLDLEDKLRQSKLALGFNADLNDWKEFTYRVSTHEERKRSDIAHRVLNSSGERVPETVYANSVQYHNCQILGLCNVKPDAFNDRRSFEPSIFKDEISKKYDIKRIMRGDFGHCKKEDCDCERCTLAYLTDLGFPVEEDREATIPATKEASSSDARREHDVPPRKCSFTPKNKLKIVDSGGFCKSIEIGLSPSPSIHDVERSCSEGGTSLTSCYDGETHQDCTNHRIKQMFQDRLSDTPIKEIQQNLKLYSDLAIVNMLTDDSDYVTADSKSKTHSPDSSWETTVQNQLSQENVVQGFPRSDQNRSSDRICESTTEKTRPNLSDSKLNASDCSKRSDCKLCKSRPPSVRRQTAGCSGIYLKESTKEESRKPSTSTLSASVSSSLSTVLSYGRVKRIFQSIIERNCPPRKPRRNIHKFREMEDLGLGEVKKNRWYPNDRRTKTIWRDMHSSVQGVQASKEFTKYPKTHSR